MTYAQVARDAASRHGAASASWLHQQGASRGQIQRWVASGLLIRRARGVFVTVGVPPSWRQRLWVALLDAGPRAVISHRSAAALLGIPGFEPGPVEVTKGDCLGHRVRCSRLRKTSLLLPRHLTTIEGLPCTTLARTLFDLAGMSSPKRRRRGLPFVHGDRVARAVDDARNRLGLTLDALREVLATMGKRGRPGTRLTRQILADRGEEHQPTESHLEDRLTQVLAAHRLPQPERQVWLGDDEAPIGRVDFRYHDPPVVIEANSKRWHSSFAAQERDYWRRLGLQGAGWAVVEVSWWQLTHEPERFVTQLRKLLDRRRSSPKGPDPPAVE